MTDRPTPMRRVAFASCAGTTIEFYDFFIYGTAVALVFPPCSSRAGRLGGERGVLRDLRGGVRGTPARRDPGSAAR